MTSCVFFSMLWQGWFVVYGSIGDNEFTVGSVIGCALCNSQNGSETCTQMRDSNI